jgi:hypothetical protein
VKGDKRSKSTPLLDALVESSQLFQVPQPGDSIFLFAGDDTLTQGRTDYRRLYESLCERGIRVFGVLFGIYLNGTYSTMGIPQGAGIIWDTSFSPENRTVHSLTWGTGGYYRQETTNNPLQRYKLTDDGLKAMTLLGMQMYGAIAEFYRVQVASSTSRSKPKPWKLQLSSTVPNIQSKYVLYPKQPPSCHLK